MADILYTYEDGVYANITNRCNCRCTFCVRFRKDGLGSAGTLWHTVEPTKGEVLQAIRDFDFAGRGELVFCGYGEPTCALENLLAAARTAREEKGLRTRLNTNGLGSLENGRDIVPALSEVIDTVSISLNAPEKESYEAITRPRFDGAFEAMLRFAEECRDHGIEVRLTVVDVLPAEQISASKVLAERIGVTLRVRESI